MRHLRRGFLAPMLAAAFAAAPQMLLAQRATPTDSASVNAAVVRFLHAFENLDWEPFHTAFSDDITAFFPTPEPPQRFVGRAAVEAQFKRVFAAIRSSAKSGPPYHQLRPVDLRIDMLSAHDALVSFELHNAERIARRTLVMRREPGGWRILHLHASNEPVPTDRKGR